MRRISIFLVFIFVSPLLAESFLSKRWIVDRQMMSEKEIEEYLNLAVEFSKVKSAQPAFIFEQALNSPNTNYFTISGSTDTETQNDMIVVLEDKGILMLNSTLELIYEGGRVVDTVHTPIYEPLDYRHDWSVVEKSSDTK